MKKSDKAIIKILDEGLKAKNLQDVVGVMESLRIHFEKHSEKNFVPFLETYFIITKNVLDKKLNQKKYFKNYDALDRIDSVFASMYFYPLKDYLSSGKIKIPWEGYFEYCKKRYGKAFVQMLLGINSHINGDLPLSLYKSEKNNKRDFMKINRVLKESIPDVMKFISFYGKDFVGFGGIIFKDFFENCFRKIIVKWRKNAWKNYKKLNSKNFKVKSNLIKKQTEEVALEITEIFEDIYGLKKIRGNKKRILKLEVKI